MVAVYRAYTHDSPLLQCVSPGLSCVPLSWIHLSDLHFGHGDAHHRWDQQLVLDELSQDIPQAIARFEFRRRAQSW